MGFSLLQSARGGSASGFGATIPYPNGSASFSSSSAGFGSATTAGSLLLFVAWLSADYSPNPFSAQACTFAISPSTPGFSWSNLTAGNTWVDGSPAYREGAISVSYIANAPSMSPSDLTTAAVLIHEGLYGGTVSAAAVEFVLFEFGASASFSLDAIIANGNQSGTATLIDPQAITTAAADLVIAVCHADSGSPTPGSGYTAGLGSAVVAGYGAVQYELASAVGVNSTAFSGSSGHWTALACAFDLAPPTAPTVTSVVPNQGPTAGGTSVAVYGTNFLIGSTVSFDGNLATGVVVVSSTKILCVTPAHAAGSVTVSVTSGGGSGNLANGYTYLAYAPTPTITSVIPNFGTTAGGTAVRIIGTNFSGTPTVTFGGVSATSVSLISSTEIDCITPAHAAGAVDVSAVVTLGTATLTNGYTYISGGGGGSTGFTPTYPPLRKQPFELWGLEAERADSATVGGIKKSTLNRLDTVTVLNFDFVPVSDLAAWKAFQQYALSGGTFTYRPLPDYPNATSSDPMFQYPGQDSGDDASGFSVCQLVSMDWTPHFTSLGNFSLAIKLKLASDF